MQQTLDGIPVNLFAGKFSGSFDMEEQLTFDDEVTFIVRSRVSGAVHSETKTGELKRTNVFTITSVAVLNDELREQVLEELESEQGIQRLPFGKENNGASRDQTLEEFLSQ